MRPLLFALFLLPACAAKAPAEVAAGCNPLVGDDCLTPFPSTVQEVADPSTTTGWRVHKNDNIPLNPARLNTRDGFSPSLPFVVYFKAGVDATQLPGADQLEKSMTPQSTVQVIDYADGSRVPAMAELDANGTTGDRLALIIRPMARLKAGARYIVALVGLRDAVKKPLAPAGFTALRDGNPLSRSLASLKPRYDEIFAKLATVGVDRKALTLAWDVITSSDGEMTSHLLHMRKTAFDMIAAGQLGYKITKTIDNPTQYVLRQVQATVQVPSFLADDSGASNLVFGADGQPAMRTVVDVPIVVNIPTCVTQLDGNNQPLFPLPRPSVVFGHGLFGNAQGSLDSSDLQSRANVYCGIYFATDWIGLATDDVTMHLPQLLGADLNNTWVITDRLQQAHLNTQVMARIFLTKIVNDDAMKVPLSAGAAPTAVTDGKEAYYFGVSNGGIQGGTFMALTDDIEKGVLNVPGCEWSLLIFRSTDFKQLRPLLTSALPDSLDEQVAIMMTQPEWDYTDPATFATHLIADPLPGVPAKKILVQESIGDAQVANLATRVLVRTMGLSGFDLEQQLYGVTEQPAPLDSAYTQWDSHPMPVPPTTNTALMSDNGAHDSVWRSQLAQQQIRAFLTKTGQATSVCGGVCSITQ
jgi:hypothetical protein